MEARVIPFESLAFLAPSVWKKATDERSFVLGDVWLGTDGKTIVLARSPSERDEWFYGHKVSDSMYLRRRILLNVISLEERYLIETDWKTTESVLPFPRLIAENIDSRKKVPVQYLSYSWMNWIDHEVYMDYAIFTLDVSSFKAFIEKYVTRPVVF